MRYFFVIAFLFFGVIPAMARAEDGATSTAETTATSTVSAVDSLRNRIAEKNQQIADIEHEIAGYQKEIEKTGAEKKTLSSQIRATNAAIATLSGDIRLTKKRIEATELALEELGIAIQEKEGQISKFRGSLAELMRTIHERESQSLVEVLLANPSLSIFFNDLEGAQNVSGNLQDELVRLQAVKTDLSAELKSRESQKRSLVALRGELTDQKTIEVSTQKEKSNLLKITQNREAVYQDQLREREQAREALDNEIFAFENELRKLTDPNSLPAVRSGILAWPIAGAMLTQSFGTTLFSKILYNGKPHNGIDIRARAGTPVMAADDGEVWETGDTDQFPRCLSYGKWVLIRHSNNLATLYGHLSLIKVAKGATVKRGEVIAYSGYTGYTVPRGPAGAHLHLTVYDASTVRFSASALLSSTCQFLPFGSYLNPLAYL